MAKIKTTKTTARIDIQGVKAVSAADEIAVKLEQLGFVLVNRTRSDGQLEESASIDMERND